MKHQFNLGTVLNGQDELIERERELTGLMNLVRSSGEGQKGGMIALVYGEAGIGKSGLIKQVTRQIGQDRTVLLGHCDPLVAARPFGPLYDMSDRLRDVLDSLQSEARSRTDIFSALAAELVATDPRAVIIVEDGHWIDTSTADFLKYLGRRISNYGFLFVISYRADEMGNGHPLQAAIGELPHRRVARFGLSHLSAEGVTSLTGFDHEKANAIHQISGGNPFYVHELLASHGDLPDSVQDLISAKLERQSPQVRSIVELISVSPEPVSPHLLTQLAGGPSVGTALEARDAGLLDLADDGRFTLRHELARLAVYERLPRARRRQLHVDFREALARSNNSATLAVQLYHADAAYESGAVLEVAQLAALAASRLGSHQEAFAHLSIARKYLDDADDVTAASIREQWAGAACVSTCMDDQVVAARADSAQVWLDHDLDIRAADNLRWLSRLHWYRCEPDLAQLRGMRAIDLLQDTGEPHAIALATALQAQLLFLDLQMEQAIQVARSAVNLSHTSKNIEAEIHALNTLGSAMSFLDHPDGVGLVRQSIQLAEQANYGQYASRDADIARGFLNLADHAADFRDFALAEEIITHGCCRCNEIDFESWVMQLTGRRAEVFLEQGRIADAVDLATQMLAYPAMTPQASQRIRLVLAKAATRIGDSAAKKLLDQCLELAEKSKDLGFEISVRLAFVEWAFLQDDTNRANMELDRLADIPTAKFHIWNGAIRQAWHNHFRGHTDSPETGAIPHGFALESEGAYDAAYQWFVNSKLPLEAVFVTLRNLKESSDTNVRLATDLVVSLGAEAIEVRLGRSASGKGRRRKRGLYKSARNHPLGLTSKEVEVLKFVAQGATNREIADQVSRSVRTIDRHVSALIKKLGVSSRVEMIVRLGNEPWILASST